MQILRRSRGQISAGRTAVCCIGQKASSEAYEYVEAASILLNAECWAIVLTVDAFKGLSDATTVLLAASPFPGIGTVDDITSGRKVAKQAGGGRDAFHRPLPQSSQALAPYSSTAWNTSRYPLSPQREHRRRLRTDDSRSFRNTPVIQ